MTAPFEKTKLAGYDVEPNGFAAGGWIARDPEGEEIAEGLKDERAAWEACDNHRMFGDVKPPAAPAQTAVRLDTRRAVCASTSNLTLETCAMLSEPGAKWPVYGGLMPDGFYICATARGDSEGAPEELRNVLAWARDNGFDYVQFDTDADPLADLPVFDHDPAPPMDPAHPDYLRSLIGQAADYVGRFADLNGEPAGGACRNLLALLEAEGYASHAKGATPAENVRRYDEQLNAWELAPNGDDYNNLHALALGGAYSPPHKGGR